MASPGSVTSSGTLSPQQNSCSEEEIQNQLIDERKRKRMQSNRESARRSRMRKQKHLDDLMVQVTNLRKTNNQLLNNINITTQQYVKIESENSVLRAQMSELGSRLQSLNDIINALNSSSNNQNLGIYGGDDEGEGYFPIIPEPFTSDGFMMNPWDSTVYLNQPIMASADMFQY
ncbi:bZIP transcription factor 11-like [Amaranthus tricolor]|uniref:bZIP transcription factor 11-like n=1 Tax=Amaranthus tricolor TaxID=29722 RepID=UPI002588839E|nr:bZIP transcription factor 11-like [Amaranthus tricolor]